MKTGKFVQFSPEQSLDILLGMARQHALDAVKAVAKKGRGPHQAVSLAQTGQMLAEIGADFQIDLDDPDNADLRAALIAEYQEWSLEFLNKR